MFTLYKFYIFKRLSTVELPPPQQLKAVKDLIQYGVETGNIQPDYTLIGHRQVRDTECPGDRLFNEIQSWPHFRFLDGGLKHETHHHEHKSNPNVLPTTR